MDIYEPICIQPNFNLSCSKDYIFERLIEMNILMTDMNLKIESIFGIIFNIF